MSQRPATVQPRRRVRALASHLCPSPVSQSAVYKHALPKTGAVVAVTGAAGYIGSWLVVKLLERGHTVRACVRDTANDKKVGFLKAMVPSSNGRLTLHSADMTAKGAYDQIFEGVHTVFHPAEVFMSFGNGRDMKDARKDFGEKVTLKAMHDNAMQSSAYIVDSINKSSTVKRLVYTASIASIMPTNMKTWLTDPIVDESKEPGADRAGEHSYAVTKRSTEHFFAYQASISGGRWSVITGNPGDIVGPVLSPHQAHETWQGKIAGIIQGQPSPQEPAGRPWMLVDARDVAEAEVRLAESSEIQSGERFMLTSGDKIYAEFLGPRIMELFPQYDCATTVAPGMAGKVGRSEPFWIRVQMRNDKVRKATGLDFCTFDDTLRETVESLVKIGGVKPKMK
uniref:NAD-dependent epimerase/dehydratase domain-containing protein n=1 Tax=Alexandrium catenella TaxID=2925 RepID=A0A7S1PSK0_ALECA